MSEELKEKKEIEEKKTPSNTLKIVLEVLAIVILVPIITYFALISKQKRSVKDYIDALHEYGLTKTVSVNKTDLNYQIFGSTDSEQVFVYIADLGDYDTAISMQPLAKLLAQSGMCVVMIDRAGYGLSEDTSKARTAQNVVDDYRTALSELGFNGPYILLAHNYGAAYAFYWHYIYSDEVKSMIFLDSPTLTNMYFEYFDYNEEYSSFDEFKKVLSGKLGNYIDTKTTTCEIRSKAGSSNYSELELDYAATLNIIHQYPKAYSSEKKNLYDALLQLDSEYLFSCNIPVCYVASDMYKGDYLFEYHIEELEKALDGDKSKVAEVMDKEREYLTICSTGYSSFPYYAHYTVDAGKAAYEYNPDDVEASIIGFMNEYYDYFTGKSTLGFDDEEDDETETWYDEETGISYETPEY